MVMTYPDYLVWLLDNNFVLFKNSYGSYKMKVVLTVTIGGDTYVYEQTTELGMLTFRLNPLLRGYGSGTVVSALAKVDTYDANDNQYTDLAKFQLKSVYGKTLQERHHASESVIVYEKPSDLSNVEILKPLGWGGQVYFGSSSYNFTGNDADVVTIGYLSPGNVNIKYNGLQFIWRGEVWDDYKYSFWDVRCVQVCPAKNGIKLTYYNTDGCKRYAIGEVLKKTMAAERKEYRQGGVVYDEPPRSLVTGYTGTIDVGFTDVEPGQYLEDIMLSPVVTTTRGTETINVIPTTLQMVRDGETKDIIITFKIDA